jgi:hypothetical protein
MALVSTSQVVTDQSAVPAVKTNQLEKGGQVRSAVGYLAAASFDGATVGQWFTFVRIPVRARVLDIYRTGGADTGALKCGIYRPDGIAIDDDVFSTVDPLTTLGTRTSIMATPSALVRTQSIATAYVTAIGTAGATGDVEVDIAMAVVTVTGTPTDCTVEVEYVLPE